MVRFEWDEGKAKTNERKHGVRFEDAMLVFADPYALVDQDRIEGGDSDGKPSVWPGASYYSSLLTPFAMRKRTKSFVSSQLEEQFGRSANGMTKIVKKSLSDSRLTAGRKRRLKKLSRQPDNKINTSDIPELTERFWQNAVRNPFYRPLKQQLTLRLDADVIAWLRRQGRGYQTRANALLRNAMLGDLNPKRRKEDGWARPNNPRHNGITQTRRAS
jgi:uncharacterized protein (DUF4415 family)/uncharacterized DUF497 family protein